MRFESSEWTAVQRDQEKMTTAPIARKINNYSTGKYGTEE